MVNSKIDTERERLRLMQQFVLNRKSVEIRYELYEYMIMSVIFRNSLGDKKIETHKIHNFVRKDFHLSKMPDTQLSDGITRLLKKRWIFKEQSKLFLSDKKHVEFSESSKRIKNIEDEVLEELKTHMCIELPLLSDKKIQLILSSFNIFINKIFKRFGIQAAQIFAETTENVDDLREFTNFSKLHIENILNDPVEAKKITNILHNFFLNPTENRSKYFFSMSQSYVLTQILNVEPNLKKIQSELLSTKTVYLDTNILINLLFIAGPKSKTIKKLIEETKKLKIQLKITALTSLELKKWLESSEKRYSKYIQPSSNLAQALDSTLNEDDDPYFTNFTKELNNNINLTSKEFSKKFYHFEDLLYNNYGIGIDVTVNELKNSTDIKDLQDIVSQCAYTSKHNDVAYHDAYCIMLIRHLRKSKQSDELGPNTWFMTIDSTLKQAEQDHYANEDIQSSITIDTWFQIISTFTSPMGSINHDTSTAFSKLLSSYFNSKKLKLNDYLNFVDALNDNADFTLNQLKKIIGNEFICERLKTINQSRESGEPPTKSEIHQAVSEIQKISKGSFDKDLKNIQEESKKKVTDAEKKVTDAEKKVTDAEKKVTDAEKKVTDAEKKVTDAEKKVKETKQRLLLITFTIISLIINVIIDLMIFNNLFEKLDESTITLLSFNVGSITGTPFLIKAFYKMD